MNIENNIILYADMIDIRKHGGKILYEDDYALLLQDSVSGILYCTALREDNARVMIAHMPEEFFILVSHDILTNPIIEEMLHLLPDLGCYHSVYLDEQIPRVELAEGYHIEQLQYSHMDEVIELYKNSMPSLATYEYISQCIEQGMVGAFEGEVLCGFIGVHDGTSIGLLEVKEEYRRKGIAVALLQCIIGKQMEKGRIPYGEIKEGNEASIKLQEKVGMQIGKELTYWYYK